MQTSQVSNPVNVISSPAPANKQSEANSSPEPFGKVLSREIADRRGNGEAGKTRETGNSASAQQPSRTSAKTSDAKPANDTKTRAKPQDDKEESVETVDAAAQASEDMLALVANISTIVPVTEAAPDAAPSPVATAQDGAAVADAALALAAGVALKAAEPVATQPVTTAQESDIAPLGNQRKTDAGLSALLERGGKSAQHAEPATKATAELPVAETAPDMAIKGQELLNGTSTATTGPADFAAAVKDSLAGIAGTAAPVQQAALHAVQSMGNNAADRLTPRVGTPAWDQALGQKVVWMVAGEQQSASLTLNPPDLGPLQVVLNVSNSQATATFIAAQPEVRQALEAAMPKLRDMLGEAGIQLGQASVNSGNPNQQGAFEQQTAQSAHSARRGDDADNGRSDAQLRTGRVQPASSGQGLVDTFV